MVLNECDGEALERALRLLDARIGALWDMVGIGLWSCRPPVYFRLELQYLRNERRKVAYFASGIGGPAAGQGVELLLTKRVCQPEDYTGPYSGGNADVNIRGLGCGVGFATAFPPASDKPRGVSIGLSSPGPSLWVAEYRIVGSW